MNKDKELELHGTPKALYNRVRAGLEGETQRAGLPLHVGGGGVLEARWDHRESLDIDVVIPTDNPDAARSALDRAAEQSGGYRVQGPGFDRIEFPDRPQEEHVDVGFNQPTPAKGVEHSSVNGRPAEVLTSTQIMTAKLTHRGLNAPVRDVFDVAVCARIEPRALEAAVNAQNAERRGAITRMYGVISDELKDQASRELRNVRPTFADIVKDPAAAGQKAIADATYQRVQIRCKGKTASITTESRLGDDDRAVVGGQVFVGAVDAGLVATGAGDGAFQLVGDPHRRGATEVLRHADVRVDPVGQLLGLGRLGVGEAAGAEHRDEQLDRPQLTRAPVAPERSRQLPVVVARYYQGGAAVGHCLYQLQDSGAVRSPVDQVADEYGRPSLGWRDPGSPSREGRTRSLSVARDALWTARCTVAGCPAAGSWRRSRSGVARRAAGRRSRS